MLVQIIKNWDYPDLLQQTPGGRGVWNDIQFTLDPVEDCDYLIVLNRPSDNLIGKSRKGGKWLFTQEPPYDSNNYLMRYFKYFDKVFTQFEPSGDNIFLSQTALPWHVEKGYTELAEMNQVRSLQRKDNVVWISSNKNFHKGHSDRLEFMNYIRKKMRDIDVFGKGINPISNKFEKLSEYKYTLAVENYSGAYYWTEKITDAYLSWCMPIYYGCKNITDYFPEESMVRIDINNPEEASGRIKQAISEKKWERNLAAIKEARELILNKYQLFPMISHLISKHLRAEKHIIKESYTIPSAAGRENSFMDYVKKRVKIFKK